MNESSSELSSAAKLSVARSAGAEGGDGMLRRVGGRKGPCSLARFRLPLMPARQEEGILVGESATGGQQLCSCAAPCSALCCCFTGLSRRARSRARTRSKRGASRRGEQGESLCDRQRSRTHATAAAFVASWRASKGKGQQRYPPFS